MSISTATLTEQLRWRYATKAFDASKTISPEIISALEEALILTPSSYGLQPWKFIVITDRDLREQLVPHSWGQRQVADASHLVVICARTTMDAAYIDTYLADMATKRGIPVSALAQLRSMIMGSCEGMSPAQLEEWSAKQCYIALGNLMTSAALLGLDTCPMEGFIPAQYDDILGLSAQGLRSVVCCPVGYRSPEDKYAGLPKVRWEREAVIEHR